MDFPYFTICSSTRCRMHPRVIYLFYTSRDSRINYIFKLFNNNWFLDFSFDITSFCHFKCKFSRISNLQLPVSSLENTLNVNHLVNINFLAPHITYQEYVCKWVQEILNRPEKILIIIKFWSDTSIVRRRFVCLGTHNNKSGIWKNSELKVNLKRKLHHRAQPTHRCLPSASVQTVTSVIRQSSTKTNLKIHSFTKFAFVYF